MTTAAALRVIVVLLAASTLAACQLLLPGQREPAPRDMPTGSPTPLPTRGVDQWPIGPTMPPLPEPPSSDELALLPEVRYDAVIPGLEAYASVSVPEVSYDVYRVLSDTAVYGDDRLSPIARLSALDFLGSPTVIVPVSFEPGWAKVMTSARQTLPSASSGTAAAQSAGWVPTDSLVFSGSHGQRVIVSLSERTMTIEQSAMLPRTYDIGIGTDLTPTPSGVTGYLQARYFDPRQGQSEHRIQLTSLHATNADEPYPGSEGGLIAAHFAERTSGSVSHGCLRLDSRAMKAVDFLPLGTSITILP